MTRLISALVLFLSLLAAPAIAQTDLTSNAGETLYEARQSESRLTREERAQLQVALKWAGFYNGAIDAAIGPGTHAAMSRWQEANGHPPTGVLTTAQRAELLAQYNAVLDGLGLRLVRDAETGIEMKLPMEAVAFEKYLPPFAHFNATGKVPGARVLLISEPGTRATLAGLYDIMQTLRIVPPDGPRKLAGDRFTLTGQNDAIVSHTEASLSNGRIKGFTLIWPTGDETRRTRLLAAMRQSFTRLPGVLDPAAASEEQDGVDLVAGLEIRRPERVRSGFFVTRDGTVVTTLAAVQGCGRVTLDDDYEARLVASAPDPGIALLRPLEPLAPSAIATFQMAPTPLNAEVTLAGYSFGGVLGAPSLSHGRLTAARGLDGEKNLRRLALDARESDSGGPVLDSYGGVIGMLLPNARRDRILPEGVSFAADAEAVTRLLSQNGIVPVSAASDTPLSPIQVSQRASEMTVMVGCWR